MIKTIALNTLIPSPRNVRRSSDPQADLELKADIEAHGLLQNLVVTSVRKPRGCFAVEAGERRRRALQALADEGRIASDLEIPCLLLDSDAAHEASLAENFQRLAMNPADECLAFQQLVEQGADADSIARRFGVTVRFVEGRLRLAALAPVVFEALGAGKISLDVAKAYAATADRERQAYVFDQMARSYMASHPDSIRRMVTQASVSASDRRARFVGEEAYLAAGGRIERDLFSAEEDARWLDSELVERLALEKMETLAAATAAEQGLAFVRPSLESWVGYAETERLRRVPLQSAPLSDEESAQVEALEDEIEILADRLENEEDGEARAEAEARIRALGKQINSIVDKPPLLPDELRGRVGQFLLLDQDGCAKLDARFYEQVEAGDEACQSHARGASGTSEQHQAPRSPAIPRRLVDELAIQRRDILAVHVAADPAFALDLAIFLMIDPLDGCSLEKSGSTLAARRPANPVFDFRTPEARAAIADAEASAALDRSWSEGETRAERFDAFRRLSDGARDAWLGHAVARTLEASAGGPNERACAFHDHLGALLGIDVAAWWRPTGGNYFDRVPKSLALGALAEVGGSALASPYAKARKPELAQACERIFGGDFIADAEVNQAALAWLPDAMRFACREQQPVSSDTEVPGGEPGGEPPEPAKVEAMAGIGEAA